MKRALALGLLLGAAVAVAGSKNLPGPLVDDGNAQFDPITIHPMYYTASEKTDGGFCVDMTARLREVKTDGGFPEVIAERQCDRCCGALSSLKAVIKTCGDICLGIQGVDGGGL